MMHQRRENICDNTLETKVREGIQFFLKKKEADKSQKNSNGISMNSYHKPPEIKLCRSMIQPENNYKPMNLYYSNYFENFDKPKPEKEQPITKEVITRSIYEEAQEELRQGFPEKPKQSKNVKIPIKFKETDFETSKVSPEKIITSEEKSKQLKTHTTPVKKKRNSPTKSLHSIEIKKHYSNASKSKISSATKIEPNKPKKSLKNINQDKELLHFTQESIKNPSSSPQIKQKSSEKIEDPLRRPTSKFTSNPTSTNRIPVNKDKNEDKVKQKEEENNLRTTVFNPQLIYEDYNLPKNSGVVRNKTNTIQVIPKADLNTSKNENKSSTKTFQKSKTDTSIITERTPKPSIIKDTLSSPLQITPLMQPDKLTDSKPIKLPQMSSYYLLKDAQERNKAYTQLSEAGSPLQKLNFLVPFNRGNTLDDSSQFKNSKKENMKITNLLLEASENYETMAKSKNEEFKKENIKEEEEEEEHKNVIKIENCEESNNDDILNEDFPLNVSESLHNLNPDLELSGFLQKKDSVTLSEKKFNEKKDESKELNSKGEEKKDIELSKENKENKDEPNEKKIERSQKMIERSQKMFEAAQKSSTKGEDDHSKQEKNMEKSHLVESQKEKNDKSDDKENKAQGLFIPEDIDLGKKLNENPNIALIQKENKFSRLFSFDNKFKSDMKNEQIVETPRINERNSSENFDKDDFVNEIMKKPDIFKDSSLLDSKERSKTQNVQSHFGNSVVLKSLTETNLNEKKS